MRFLINSFEDYMLPCLSKQLFNLECFGCGLQRSVFLLFQGEIIAAFKMYPAIYPLIVLALFLILNFFYKIKYSEKIKIALVVLSIATIIINYLIKIIN
ncbi:MAG: DUF2752 domain-containing protein [Flavobacteriaceae bacterium]|nr:DUF2752 domain-containing protein [Flavobacteriaceae bacterium]